MPHLAIGKACPARAKAQLLGQQYQLFAVIAHALVKVIAFPSCHDEVVFHAREGTIGHDAAESLGLAYHQLYVQPALAVASIDFFLKGLYDFGAERTADIVAHAVALPYSFDQCNHRYLFIFQVYITSILRLKYRPQYRKKKIAEGGNLHQRFIL